jgi:hypothetical protein
LEPGFFIHTMTFSIQCTLLSPESPSLWGKSSSFSIGRRRNFTNCTQKSGELRPGANSVYDRELQRQRC